LEGHLLRAQTAQGPLCEPEILALAQTCLASAKEEFQEGDYWEADDILDACQKKSEGIWDRILACGKDLDVDGVPDLNDLCPNAPETYNGYRDRDGCPDRIPERAVLATNKIEIIEPLHFDDATHQLLPSSDRVLRDVVRILDDNQELQILVQAYLDDSVPPERALEITTIRANNVKNALVALGAPSHRIEPVGMGSRDPVAPNDSPMGRRVNQRIEFVSNPLASP
jgi:outer membrane protein OmpA-like peptidoglycan-associated protein